MEMQFHKTVIPYLHTVCRQMKTQEQTQEVRLPEGMPDIGRVLAGWGQIIIRSKEWHPGGANVSGGVMAWILYLPEDGSQAQSVETWLPFQVKWDFPDTQRDGAIQVIPVLRGVDARSLSARKLMVRATVGFMGQATVPADAELYTPGEIPQDVKLLKRSYPMELPVEAGEKAFQLEETVSLPPAATPIKRIVRYWLWPELAEKKVVSDKLVIRGTATLGILYMGADEQLHSWEFELPFSQYTQLDREFEPNADADIQFAVTGLELEKGEEDNLMLKAGITAQYIIFDHPVMEIVEDAYSPSRPVAGLLGELELPAVLDRGKQMLRPEQSVQTDISRVADVTFFPEQPQLYREGDNVRGEMAGLFQILGYDADGQLQSALARWEDDWTMMADEHTQVEMSVKPGGKPAATVMADSANMTAELQMNVNTVANRPIPMLTGLELGEQTQPDANRPSIIVRRAGQDTLWKIAKENGSTVEAIAEANHLQQEPEEDQILLIPVL